MSSPIVAPDICNEVHRHACVAPIREIFVHGHCTLYDIAELRIVEGRPECPARAGVAQSETVCMVGFFTDHDEAALFYNRLIQLFEDALDLIGIDGGWTRNQTNRFLLLRDE